MCDHKEGISEDIREGWGVMGRVQESRGTKSQSIMEIDV